MPKKLTLNKLILLLVIIVIGGYLYFYQPNFLISKHNSDFSGLRVLPQATPDTTNWKVYTSGYWKIKYPPEFISENGRHGSYIADSDKTRNIADLSKLTQDQIIIGDRSIDLIGQNDLSDDKLIQDDIAYQAQTYGSASQILNKEKISTPSDGTPHFRVTKVTFSDRLAYYFLVPGGNNETRYLEILEVRPTDTKYLDIFNNMLQTLGPR